MRERAEWGMGSGEQTIGGSANFRFPPLTGGTLRRGELLPENAGETIESEPDPGTPVTIDGGSLKEGGKKNRSLQPFLTIDETRPPSPPANLPFEQLPERSEEPKTIDLSAIAQKANQILQSAQREASQIRQSAYAEGYEAGWNQAQAEVQQAFQTHIQRLQEEVRAFLDQLNQQFSDYLRQIEPQVLELVLEIARKIVRDEIRQHPEHVLNVVRDTLRRVKGFGAVRVRVNPADLERVRQARSHLLSVLEGVDSIEIVEDRRVETGSCIVETEHGTYDARISTQFEEIERILRHAIL